MGLNLPVGAASERRPGVAHGGAVGGRGARVQPQRGERGFRQRVVAAFLSPRWGFYVQARLIHGSRRGLLSAAALRLPKPRPCGCGPAGGTCQMRPLGSGPLLAANIEPGRAVGPALGVGGQIVVLPETRCANASGRCEQLTRNQHLLWLPDPGPAWPANG